MKKPAKPWRDPIQLEIPYGDTSGWSGTDTSRERAVSETSDGTYTARQYTTISFLARRGTYGATWAELAEEYGYHHGQASGVLSGLHKTEHIARLAERRGRCKVYVLPEYVDDRITEPYTPHKAPDTSHDEILAWLSSVSASPESNVVEAQWAQYFAARIAAHAYRETA